MTNLYKYSRINLFMSSVAGDFGITLLNIYMYITSLLPSPIQKFVNFLFIVIIVVVFSIFIWKFYQSISTKNIIELDLNQYNQSKYPGFAKTLAFLFYVLEYIVIFPLLIFAWFSIFTIFLILLTENYPINTLLILSATVIAAIRFTAYYRKKLSEDLAKLIPFTLLSVSLLNPSFFSIERVFNQFQQLSVAFGDAFIYLGFIVGMELILRTMDSFFSYFGIGDDEETDSDK